MFPLHDRTRRRVVLAAFGALCVLPTLLVLLWGLSRQMPWHVAAEVRRLETIVGVRVRLDRAWNTRPGVWRYEGFALHDPETGHRIFRCEQLEVSYAGRGASTPASLVLTARGAAADDAAGTVLRELLSRVMRGQMGPAPLNLQWTADELAFGEGDRAIRLAALSGRTQPHPGGIRTQLGFHLADGAGAEPAYVEIHRNRQVAPAGMELKLYTGADSLPARLLAAGLPAFEPLGPDCGFRGYLRADWTPSGWRGELNGSFSDVDLGRLVRERFGQHLVAQGHVRVDRADFEEGRIREAFGSVEFGPGTIGWRLLDTAVEQMSLTQNAPPVRDDPVPFRLLAANWRLAADGLRVEGQCSSAGPGTVLAGVEPWYVGQPVVQPLPVAALVRALAPGRYPEVPATHPAAWLLRHLPLPDSNHGSVNPRSATSLPGRPEVH